MAELRDGIRVWQECLDLADSADRLRPASGAQRRELLQLLPEWQRSEVCVPLGCCEAFVL
jgi:hypothetical protein